MPKPIAINTGAKKSGTIKQGVLERAININQNFGANYGGLTWYSSLDPDTGYVIISDTYTMGLSTYANSKPVMWKTDGTTDSDVLTTINGLPNRIGLTRFTQISDASSWLLGSKISMVTTDEAPFSTDGSILYLDSSNLTSYPGYGTTWYDLSGQAYNLFGGDINYFYNEASSTTSNQTDPFGGSNAYLITETTNNYWHGVSYRSGGWTRVNNGVGENYSIYAKNYSGDRYFRIYFYFQDQYVMFDLQNGTVVGNTNVTIFTPSIESAGNGYYRCSVAVNWNVTKDVGPFYSLVPKDNSSTFAYVGNTSSGVYLFGPQRTQGLDLKPYVNVYDAYLTNGPTYETKSKSIVLDGVNDYINCGLINYNRNTFSVFGWVNYTENHSGWKSGFITKWNTGGSDGSGNEWFLGTDNNTGPSPFAATVQYGAGSNSYIAITDTSNYVANTWYHVGFTWNNGVLKLYKNGNLVSSGTTNNTAARVTSQPLYIGTFYYQPTQYPSKIKTTQAIMYNSALTNSDISTLYTATVNPLLLFSSNLRVWYDMSAPVVTTNTDYKNTIDKTNGTTTLSRVFDLSGNGYHMTQSVKAQQLLYSLNSKNNKAGLTSLGTSMTGMAGGSIHAGERTFFIVGKGSSTSWIQWNRGGAIQGSLQLGWMGGGGWNDRQQDTWITQMEGGNSNDTFVMSYLFRSDKTIIYRNGNSNRYEPKKYDNLNDTYTANAGTLSLFSRWLGGSYYDQNDAGTIYEIILLDKIPTIAEYNTMISYLSNKWAVTCGSLTNFN